MAEVRVRLTPRAHANEVSGEREDGTLLVRVAAPPVDGKANAALVKLLAKHFSVPRSKVRIVRGEASREKLISIG